MTTPVGGPRMAWFTAMWLQSEGAPDVNANDQTPNRVSSVRCPTCHVGVGEPCKLSMGGLRVEPHRDRELIAMHSTVERDTIWR
jgi:hypothetical protein